MTCAFLRRYRKTVRSRDSLSSEIPRGSAKKHAFRIFSLEEPQSIAQNSGHMRIVRAFAAVLAGALSFPVLLGSWAQALSAQDSPRYRSTSEPQVVFDVEAVPVGPEVRAHIAASLVEGEQTEIRLLDSEGSPDGTLLTLEGGSLAGVLVLRQNASVRSLLSRGQRGGRARALTGTRLRTFYSRPVRYWIGAKAKVPTLPTNSAVSRDAPWTPEREVGVFVELEPRRYPDGDLYVRVDANVTNIDFGASTVRSEHFVPSMAIRSLARKVKVTPGQTILVAGLITEESIAALRRIPALMKRPLVQALTDSRLYTDDRVVWLLITPRLLNNPANPAL